MDKLINSIKAQLSDFDDDFYNEIIKNDYSKKSKIYKTLSKLNQIYLKINLLDNFELYKNFINIVMCVYDKVINLNSNKFEEFLLKHFSAFDFFRIEDNLQKEVFINNDFYKKYCLICKQLPKSIFVANQIYKNAKNYKYISFDIFDTLVFRPYENPVDLFEHLGSVNNINNFKELRVKAEQKARELNNFKEVTIDEIYLNLPQELMFLKELEIKLEKQVLSANVRFVKLINDLKTKNKTIIITSDMYLNEKTIEEILKINNINYDYLFLSSKYRKTKHDGDLFEEIIKKLNINYCEVLHIGDNKHADYNNALKLGLKSILINKYKDEIQLNNCVKNNLVFNIHYHLLKMQKYHNRLEFWEEIGYRYAGILALFVANLTSKNAEQNKCNSIFFIARDGFLVQKFYRLLDNKLPSFYIYLSRHIANQLKQDVYQEFFKSYLLGKCKNYGKIQMLDIISVNFSAQKGLLNFFKNDDIHATYIMVGKEKFNLNLDYVLEINDFNFLNIFLIETLLSAPTPSIKGFNNNYIPKYGDIDNNEKIRCEIYKKITKGAILFAYDVKKYNLNEIFKRLDDLRNDVFEYLQDYMLNASKEDLIRIKNLKHADNEANDSFVGMDKHFYNYRRVYYRNVRKRDLKYFLKYVFYKYKMKLIEKLCH